MKYKYEITTTLGAVILAEDYYKISSSKTRIIGVGNKGKYVVELDNQDILEIR